jgi:pyridoxal biosynthesis lyase PdxS
MENETKNITEKIKNMKEKLKKIKEEIFQEYDEYNKMIKETQKEDKIINKYTSNYKNRIININIGGKEITTFYETIKKGGGKEINQLISYR